MIECPKLITKEQYEEDLAQKLGMTVERLHQENAFAMPCDCIEKTCQGWKLVDYRIDPAAAWGVPKEVAHAFARSLAEHIHYVKIACRYLKDIDERQFSGHDDSKWGVDEFAGYAMHFYGGGAPDSFARAWLHHLQNNPHHWQHWIFPDGFTPKGSRVEDGCIEMPHNYALEMVADWAGASRAYTGSWDMASWLTKNMPKIKVHSRTAEYLREVLDTLGYADVVNVQSFGGGKNATES